MAPEEDAVAVAVVGVVTFVEDVTVVAVALGISEGTGAFTPGIAFVADTLF